MVNIGSFKNGSHFHLNNVQVLRYFMMEMVMH